jgi:hypothetical protein
MSIKVINISEDQFNALLDEKVEKIISALTLINKEPPSDQWFDLKGLIEYLPSHPKPQTVYDWTHKNIIPYYKSPETKVLSFLKSEIDVWLKSGRRKTQDEKSRIVKKYFERK